jgi:hypothetical protein
MGRTAQKIGRANHIYHMPAQLKLL